MRLGIIFKFMSDYTPMEMFYSWEISAPERVFLSQPLGGKYYHFTWKKVGEEVRKVVSYILSLQLPKESKIGIFGFPTAHWVMSELAILMSEHVAVPIHHNVTPEDLEHIIRDSKMSMIFIGRPDIYIKYKKVIPDSIVKVSLPYSEARDGLWWEEIQETFDTYNHSPEIDNLKPSYIFYTAGTTGLPKGVLHSLDSLSWPIKNFMDVFRLKQHSRFLAQLSLAHLSSKTFIQMAAIYTGSSIVFIDKGSPLSEAIAFTKPQVFISVPYQWNMLKGELSGGSAPNGRAPLLANMPLLSYFYKRAKRKKAGFHKTRYFISAEEGLSDYLYKWFRTNGINIMEMYGQTENAGYAHINPPHRTRQGTVGTPVRHSKTELGNKGQILVCNRALMLGYQSNNGASLNRSSVDMYFNTGDIGEIDKIGHLKIIANSQDLICTKDGKYLAPAQIEKLLFNSDLISQACLIGNGSIAPLGLLGLTEYGKSLPTKELENALEGLLDYINSKCRTHQIKSLVIVPEEWTPENGLLTPSYKPRRHIIEDYYAPLVPLWFNNSNKIVWSS